MPVLRLPQLVLAYVATLAAFLAIDAVWLGVVMKQAYAAWLGPLMLAQPKLPAAGLFYLLYVVGLMVFAVMPGLRERNWRTTAWRARESDEEFAKAEQDGMEEGGGRAEQEAFRRAVVGFEEPVIDKGRLAYRY